MRERERIQRTLLELAGPGALERVTVPARLGGDGLRQIGYSGGKTDYRMIDKLLHDVVLRVHLHAKTPQQTARGVVWSVNFSTLNIKWREETCL